VKFSIYAHTGGWDRKSPWSWSNRNNGYQVWILKIKGPNEAWGRQPRTRLAHLRPLIENLDGHTIEFYRKQLEKSQATDRILLYYTDGEMPAANKYEELDILQRELGELDRRGIIKLAVGINTDSPSRYGFDTVQVDCDEDLVKVVTQLRRYLL
jgi:nitric oxide reductase activation protein